MSLETRIHALNQEWADAGDDVPDELKYIRLLRQRIDLAIGALIDMDDAEDPRIASQLNHVMNILEGEP